MIKGSPTVLKMVMDIVCWGECLGFDYFSNKVRDRKKAGQATKCMVRSSSPFILSVN